MTENEAMQVIQESLNLKMEHPGLLILHSIKKILEICGDNEDVKLEQGLLVVNLASCHTLTDDQLLTFFETTIEAVKEAGEEFIQEHGLYKALVTSPHLSPVCKLFFDVWMEVYYKDHPLRCQIRRIGINAYKLVAFSSEDVQTEYPETITEEEALQYSNCPVEDLRNMPILN